MRNFVVDIYDECWCLQRIKAFLRPSSKSTFFHLISIFYCTVLVCPNLRIGTPVNFKSFANHTEILYSNV